MSQQENTPTEVAEKKPTVKKVLNQVRSETQIKLRFRMRFSRIWN